MVKKKEKTIEQNSREQNSQGQNAHEREPVQPIVQILIVLSVIIATVAIYFFMTNSGNEKAKYGAASQQHSSTWRNVGGNFALTDVDGKHFLSAKLRGRPNLIYFGFISCPDICPTELQKITASMEMLDKENIEVTPVFITIDPERDTAEIIKKYLSNFHPAFVGLTGSSDQIKKVADMFNVYYERAGDANDPNYMMNHTAYIYLLDKSGKFVRFFDTSSGPEEIAIAVKDLK